MKNYLIRSLKFDGALVKKVMAQRKKGESIAKVAETLKVGVGKVAMAEMIGSNRRISITDPAELAKAIVKDRKAGDSWGLLAARYGITEGTARAAYEAAAGEPFTALDYRRKATA